MKLWRIFVAFALLVGSYVGLFLTSQEIHVPVVELLCFLLALLAGMGALSLAQDDGRERGEK